MLASIIFSSSFDMWKTIVIEIIKIFKVLSKSLVPNNKNGWDYLDTVDDDNQFVYKLQIAIILKSVHLI